MKKIRNIIFILMLIVLMSACGGQSKDSEEFLLSDQEEDTENDRENEDAEQEQAKTGTETENLVYVQVSGAVKCPGHEIPGCPLPACIHLELAGGMTKEADPASLNQAEHVEDGQMIRVLTFEEAAARTEDPGTAQPEDDGKVNLNTAAKEELMTLAGIGEAKAESILAWRKEHGDFAQIEDLMKIEGIKEGVFSKIRDSVKVQ